MMRILQDIRHKVVTSDEAAKIIREWQKEAKKVVFTNGCFDILHEGHVTYLALSADKGDKLVLGLNSDASVRRQGKGNDRPVNPQSSRALILAALAFVDLVVIFDEDTPLELIKVAQPNVLVKGADYDPQENDPTSKKYIVGSKEVKSYGGMVGVIPLVDGFSTTAILKKIKT
jgi:rfaE bifunctional protein nucleotidyltransferase chain/domain